MTFHFVADYVLAMNTMTRAQLTEQIYARVGLSRNESAELLEFVLRQLAGRLATGEAVKIAGFGTFLVRRKGLRVGRNPRTGVEAPVLPRRVLVFRPSPVLKGQINGEICYAADLSKDEGLQKPR